MSVTLCLRRSLKYLAVSASWNNEHIVVTLSFSPNVTKTAVPSLLLYVILVTNGSYVYGKLYIDVAVSIV